MSWSLNYPMLNLFKIFLILCYLNLMAILLNILRTYTQGSIKNYYKYQEQRVFTWWLHATPRLHPPAILSILHESNIFNDSLQHESMMIHQGCHTSTKIKFSVISLFSQLYYYHPHRNTTNKAFISFAIKILFHIV